MPTQTHTKQHNPSALIYNAGSLVAFDNVASVAINQANTVIQARLGLPCNFKIFGISIVGGANTVANAKFNLVVGEGAESGVAVPTYNIDGATAPAVATAGQSAFVADKAVVLVAGVPQLFIPDNFDGVYPPGLDLTLRLITDGTGTFTNCKVTLLLAPFDIAYASKPSTAAFNPATDL